MTSVSLNCTFFSSVNFLEKSFRINQCSFGFGHQVGKILPGLQTDLKDSAPGQSQAGADRQQHAISEVSIVRMVDTLDIVKKNVVLFSRKETIWSLARD